MARIRRLYGLISGLLLAAMPMASLAQDNAQVLHDPAQEVAAYYHIMDELFPDEEQRFFDFFATLHNEQRHALLELTEGQPSGDRGIFVMLVVDQRPEIRRAMVDFLSLATSAERARLARDLGGRMPYQWQALPNALETVPVDEALAAMLDARWVYTCGREREFIAFLPEPEEPDERAPPARDCSDDSIKFWQKWSSFAGGVVRAEMAEEGTLQWQAQLFRAGASAASYQTPEQHRIDRETYGRVLYDWEHDHVCGGVYLGEKWVLTAAHCVAGWETREAAFFDGRRIRLGSHQNGGGGQVLEIDALVIHGQYKSAVQGDDIALLRLATAPSVAGVQKAELPYSQVPLPGTRLTLSGWGLQGETVNSGDRHDRFGRFQFIAQFLMAGKASLRNRTDCNDNEDFKENGVVLRQGQLCVGGVDEEQDACKGDSGGPLVWEQRSRPILIGLVSFGVGCGLSETPGVYTDVRHYLRWISGAKKKVRSQHIVRWN